MPRIAIAGVTERDIDLLLLEEFLSSPAFQEWFVRSALGPDQPVGRCIAAERSVTHTTGESDLEITFDTPTGITRFLIENKINAGLQPLQAERYHERGREYVERQLCATVHTVIVAPDRYFGTSGSNKGFDFRLSYEQLREWFHRAEHLGDRRQYKIALLTSAIEKGTLGYQPAEDRPTTEFWRSYWQLARHTAPKLEMREPVSKPSGAGFVHFRPSRLPRGVSLCHKLVFGNVDLQFARLGNRLNELHSTLESHLEEGMSIANASRSGAIRLVVPKLNPCLPFEPQADHVRTGIEAAAKLLDWALRHRKAWEPLVAPPE